MKTFFWRTHYAFGIILFWTLGQIISALKLFCSSTAMIQPHFLAKKFFLRKLVKFGQVWLDLCEIKVKFGRIWGKIWAKIIRFEQIGLWLDLGKIKIFHPSFTAMGKYMQTSHDTCLDGTPKQFAVFKTNCLTMRFCFWKE